MATLFEFIGRLVREARAVRENQGGGDSDDDEARASALADDELDEIEDEEEGQ